MTSKKNELELPARFKPSNQAAEGVSSMKTFLAGIFAGILLCCVALAQDATPQGTTGTNQGQANPTATQPPATQAPQTGAAQASGVLRIAPGSVIPVQLTKGVDAKEVKTGDQVEAKVTQDLKAGTGEVVVPKDTKMVGRITEAQARNKEQKESQLGIAFDRAVLKNGSEAQLPMSIQAIIAPSALNPDSGNNSGGGETGQPAPENAPGGTSPSTGGGRAGMGSGAPAQYPNASSSGAAGSPGQQTGAPAHEPITGNTQGVVGISDLKLSAGDAKQGSIVSSEKNNVKLESGTLMLLRVNQVNAQ
jgi:hypothetical protein